MAAKGPNGLTPKQNKLQAVLLRQIVETGETNLTQAGLQVYDSKSPKAAYEIAKEALDNTGIKERLEQALAKNGITPDLITNEIKGLAVREVDKISGDVKLKASIELLKLMGAYPGSKHTNVSLNIKGTVKDMSHSEVKEELKVIDSELNELLEEPSNPTG